MVVIQLELIQEKEEKEEKEEEKEEKKEKKEKKDYGKQKIIVVSCQCLPNSKNKSHSTQKIKIKQKNIS